MFISEIGYPHCLASPSNYVFIVLIEVVHLLIEVVHFRNWLPTLPSSAEQASSARATSSTYLPPASSKQGTHVAGGKKSRNRNKGRDILQGSMVTTERDAAVKPAAVQEREQLSVKPAAVQEREQLSVDRNAVSEGKSVSGGKESGGKTAAHESLATREATPPLHVCMYLSLAMVHPCLSECGLRYHFYLHFCLYFYFSASISTFQPRFLVYVCRYWCLC